MVDRSAIVAWIAKGVLPHEPQLRAWLRRSMAQEQDIDDVIHETYCRLASLASVEHIENPRAYFFEVARNVVLEEMRRARLARIELVAEIEALHVPDESPSVERIVAGHRELALVQSLISALPDRCRQVFVLRKIHGLSQRQIASTLGETEHAVEKQVARGLRLILKALAKIEGSSDLALSGRGSHFKRKQDHGKR